MSARVFVDTNILVYSRDASEVEKQPRAIACLEKLWRERRGRISTQVLNEYYVTVTRKLAPGMPADDAWEDVCALMAWAPAPIDEELLRRAREIERKHSISWWDALIVAAAVVCGCDVIYSEDLGDGQVYAGIRVENPLLPATE